MYNTDGILNKNGAVMKYVTLQVVIQDHIKQLEFAVSNLGEDHVYQSLMIEAPQSEYRLAELEGDPQLMPR